MTEPGLASSTELKDIESELVFEAGLLMLRTCQKQKKQVCVFEDKAT